MDIRRVKTITTSSTCNVEPVVEEAVVVGTTTVEVITHVAAEAMEEKLTPSMMVPPSLETIEVDTAEVAEEAIIMMPQKTEKAYNQEVEEAEADTTVVVSRIPKDTSQEAVVAEVVTINKEKLKKMERASNIEAVEVEVVTINKMMQKMVKATEAEVDIREEETMVPEMVRSTREVLTVEPTEAEDQTNIPAKATSNGTLPQTEVGATLSHRQQNPLDSV